MAQRDRELGGRPELEHTDGLARIQSLVTLSVQGYVLEKVDLGTILAVSNTVSIPQSPDGLKEGTFFSRETIKRALQYFR